MSTNKYVYSTLMFVEFTQLTLYIFFLVCFTIEFTLTLISKMVVEAFKFLYVFITHKTCFTNIYVYINRD